MTAGATCVLVNVLLHEMNVNMSEWNKHTNILRLILWKVSF